MPPMEQYHITLVWTVVALTFWLQAAQALRGEGPHSVFPKQCGTRCRSTCPRQPEALSFLTEYGSKDSSHHASTEASLYTPQSFEGRRLGTLPIVLNHNANNSEQETYLTCPGVNANAGFNILTLEVTNGWPEKIAISRVEFSSSEVSETLNATLRVGTLHLLPGDSFLEEVKVGHIFKPFSGEITVQTSLGLMRYFIRIVPSAVELFLGSIPLQDNRIDLGFVAEGTVHYRTLRLVNKQPEAVNVRVRSMNNMVLVVSPNESVPLLPHGANSVTLQINVDAPAASQYIKDAVVILQEKCRAFLDVKAQVLSGTIDVKYTQISRHPEAILEGGSQHVRFSISSTADRAINIYEIAVEDKGYRFALDSLLARVPPKALWLPVAELGFSRLIPGMFVQGEMPPKVSEEEVSKMKVRNSMWRSFRKRNKTLVSSTLQLLTDVMGTVQIPFSFALTQPTVFEESSADLLVDFGTFLVNTTSSASITLQNPSHSSALTFDVQTPDIAKCNLNLLYHGIGDVQLLLPLQNISLPVEFVAADTCVHGCECVTYILNNLTRLQRVVYRGRAVFPKLSLTGEGILQNPSLFDPRDTGFGSSRRFYNYSTASEDFKRQHGSHRRWFRKAFGLHNEGEATISVIRVKVEGLEGAVHVKDNRVNAGASVELVLEVFGLENVKESLHVLTVELSGGWKVYFDIHLENSEYRSHSHGSAGAGALVGMIVLLVARRMGTYSIDEKKAKSQRGVQGKTTLLPEPRPESQRISGCSDPLIVPSRSPRARKASGIRKCIPPLVRAPGGVIYAEELERQLQSFYCQQTELTSGSEATGVVELLQLPRPRTIQQVPIPPAASQLKLWKGVKPKDWSDVVDAEGQGHFSCFVVEPLELLKNPQT